MVTSLCRRFTHMGGTRYPSVLLLCLVLMYPIPGRLSCREAQLTRDCASLCSKDKHGVMSCELRVAVLLPADPKFEISLPKVRPVLDLAEYEARSRGLLPYWLKLTYLLEDDRCDATYAQISSFDSYSKCVHLFLGPACDYCVAVVGRVTKFLGTPLITTGGFTFDFTKKKQDCEDEYFMTTRIGNLAFRDVASFFVRIMDQYKWHKVYLIYDTGGQSKVAGKHTCQLMMKSMVEFVKKRQDFTYLTFDVETTTAKHYPEALKDHVGNTHAGVSICCLQPENFIASYEPHGYCVVYSTTDETSVTVAEVALKTLWNSDYVSTRAVILVGNKVDLVRSRSVSIEEGKSMATLYNCKFIETSVGINHNVDELLVGLLTQIRLKFENTDRTRDTSRKRSRKNCSRSPQGSCSENNSPKKYRGKGTSASLRVRNLLDKVWTRDSKSKSCENLHVL